MPRFYCWVLLVGLTPPVRASPPSDSLTCARIQYVLALKEYVAQRYWPSFGKKPLYRELQVRTPGYHYIANPSKATLARPAVVPCPCEGVVLVRKPSTDTTFVLATGFHADLVADVSDVEAAIRYIPGQKTTEEWAIIVVHELMHQYQGMFRKGILKRSLRAVTAVSQDSLGAIFRNYEALSRSVRRENQVLLGALAAADEPQVKDSLTVYLRLKRAHRAYLREQWGKGFAEVEDVHEILESGTRLVEYHLSNDLKQLPPFQPLVGIDPLYSANQAEAIRQFSLEKQGRYLWNVIPTYGYAIGFNSIRLLEKLGIRYQDRLYARKRFSFEREFSKWLKRQ